MADAKNSHPVHPMTTTPLECGNVPLQAGYVGLEKLHDVIDLCRGVVAETFPSYKLFQSLDLPLRRVSIKEACETRHHTRKRQKQVISAVDIARQEARHLFERGGREK